MGFGKSKSKMNLIISGSIYSLMHRIFEDSKEPLFSRANRIINLRAFDTDVLKEIYMTSILTIQQATCLLSIR